MWYDTGTAGGLVRVWDGDSFAPAVTASLGGLRFEAEGLEILGGPDGEGRGRPIRTVQPSQRGCRQARCSGLHHRPP